VFGNAGTIVSFRVGYADAEILEREFAHVFHAGEFIDLPKFEVLMKVAVDGQSSFRRARALPPLSNQCGRREKIIRQSQQKYATPRKLVEEKLSRWLGAS